jgi:hypothetical protein
MRVFICEKEEMQMFRRFYGSFFRVFFGALHWLELSQRTITAVFKDNRYTVDSLIDDSKGVKRDAEWMTAGIRPNISELHHQENTNDRKANTSKSDLCLELEGAAAAE